MRLNSTLSDVAKDRLMDLERNYCSYGDTVHYAQDPPIFSRCEGSFLYDSEGRPYLDLHMWFSAVNLGYANPRIIRAVKEQMGVLPQLASQYLHASRIELAALISASVERAFGTRGRVQFNVGGAQAIEDSLMLVRKHTGKSRMLALEGGYHGRSQGAVSVTASFQYRDGFGDFPQRAELLPFPDCFRCPYGQTRSQCELFCAQQVERKFGHEFAGICNPTTGNTEIGAVYIEPVQGNGGYVAPPDGYVNRLVEACHRYGILVVADEIQMGFFRTGKMWATEHLGIQPDVIVFGKSLTNGMSPLSGIWAREELLNPDDWPPGSMHSTFAAHPLATAAGVEVMKILSESDYETSVREKKSYFIAGLTNLQKKYPEIGLVEGTGLAIRVEICAADGRKPNRELANRMFQAGLAGELEILGHRYGLVLEVGGPYKSTLTIAPSLDISYDEMKLAIDLLDVLLAAVR